MFVFTEPKEFSFDKVSIKGKIFPTSTITQTIQYFLVETETGHQTSIIEHQSDFCYYILEGSGYFVIDGNTEQCDTGNLVIIPAGKKFTHKGKLKMIATSTPPWKEDQEETIC